MERLEKDNAQLRNFAAEIKANVHDQIEASKHEMRQFQLTAPANVVLSTTQADEIGRELLLRREIPKAIAQPGRIGMVSVAHTKRGSGALCPTQSGPRTLGRSKGAFISVGIASIKRPQKTAEAKEMGLLTNAIKKLRQGGAQQKDVTRDDLIADCHGLYAFH